MWKSKRRRIDGIFKIKEMKGCCKNHLKSLKLPIMYNNTGLDISKKDLMENRINRKLDDSHGICACHRYSLGTYYRPSIQIMIQPK